MPSALSIREVVEAIQAEQGDGGLRVVKRVRDRPVRSRAILTKGAELGYSFAYTDALVSMYPRDAKVDVLHTSRGKY